MAGKVCIGRLTSGRLEVYLGGIYEEAIVQERRGNLRDKAPGLALVKLEDTHA